MVRNVLMFAQKLCLLARNLEIKQKEWFVRAGGNLVNRARGSTYIINIKFKSHLFQNYLYLAVCEGNYKSR